MNPQKILMGAIVATATACSEPTTPDATGSTTGDATADATSAGDTPADDTNADPSDSGDSDDSSDGGEPEPLPCAPGLLDVPAPTTATIGANPGQDTYALTMSLSDAVVDVTAFRIQVADAPDGGFEDAGSSVATTTLATGEVDKLATDIYVRAAVTHESGCVAAGPPARLAKPDYADPAVWANGWIRAVSHNHTIPDLKLDAGDPVHANRINWFNGCFEVQDAAACHALLLRSFSQDGLQWMMDAAADHGIDSVIVTDHDNVGIWYTDVFKAYNKGNASGPSVVAGLEWTSALGHLTVIGNFLPAIDPDADIEVQQDAQSIHSAVPLPTDLCDDTDENQDINAPAFDGPDAPCARADHRGYGDDPISIADARASIEAMHDAGALVYVNHPTNDPMVQPPMNWRLDNLDVIDGVEVGVPDPTLSNRNTPEYWRQQGLMNGRKWVGISGTDCHVDEGPYTGDTGCNDQWGVVHLTHLDAPYMWLQPLSTTARPALNDPELVVAALREGRVVVVQDNDPAVIVDLGIDVNADGRLDYWGGSTVPACEQPDRDTFTVQVRVRPLQDHNYNVSVWRRDEETKILQDQALDADQTWVGEIEFSRAEHIPSGTELGYIMVQVRENKTLNTDNDAGFATPVWFQTPQPGISDCHTRDVGGV